VKLVRLITALSVLSICGKVAIAADLHPIVEVQSGYLFGATSDGKWIKAVETAKALPNENTYRIYGLTEALGEAKASKATQEGAPCEETLAVSLSPKPGKGVIALAAPWNALPRKPRVLDTAQPVYIDAVRDFLKAKGIDEPKVKTESILRVDLDGDGEDEVLISATNYSSKDRLDYAPAGAPHAEVPMRSSAGSYSMVLLRRVVAGKVEHSWSMASFTRKPT